MRFALGSRLGSLIAAVETVMTVSGESNDGPLIYCCAAAIFGLDAILNGAQPAMGAFP